MNSASDQRTYRSSTEAPTTGGMALNARTESGQPAVTLLTGVRWGHVRSVWPLVSLTSAIGPLIDTGVNLVRDVHPGGGMALTRLRHQWNTLAQRDALGSVLTRPRTAPLWDVDDFFETGRSDVARLMAAIARLAPALSARRALDFGCGVGRLTQALAAYFDDVRGIDVAVSMIARARHENRSPERCHFEVNRRPHLRRFDDGTFDLVYSRLVLQHMPPRLVRRYLPELLRVLAPGGLLVFQLPTQIDDPERAFYEAPVRGGPLKRALPPWMVHAYRGVKYSLLRTGMPDMDMFGMARETVVDLVEGCGAQILAIEPDQSHGTPVPGFQYWVTTSRSSPS